MALAKPCLTCGQTTRSGSYCPRCDQRRRGTPTQRGYTATYQRLRLEVLDEEDICWICGQPGRPGDPLTADHVTPLRDGGPTTRTNLRAAHRSCNSRR